MFGIENVWIGIGQNSDKKDIDREHLKFSIIPITRNVICYDTLTADVVKAQKFDLLIRGVRPSFSLEQEHQLCYWNKRLCGVDTILIPTPPDVNMISSGAIRELVKYHHPLQEYMNADVISRWLNKEPKINVYFGKCCSGKSTYLREQKKNVVEFDRVFKNYINSVKMNEEQLTKHLIRTKERFYNKDEAFKGDIGILGKFMHWHDLFDYEFPPDFDIPVIGNYWDSIPRYIRSRLRLIKCRASEEDRQYFAEQRKVNPKLIECNNFFYNDPPFWDEEIIIKKM
jgi:phosphopantetheine adenylyltransferase